MSNSEVNALLRKGAYNAGYRVGSRAGLNYKPEPPPYSDDSLVREWLLGFHHAIEDRLS